MHGIAAATACVLVDGGSRSARRRRAAPRLRPNPSRLRPPLAAPRRAWRRSTPTAARRRRRRSAARPQGDQRRQQDPLQALPSTAAVTRSFKSKGYDCSGAVSYVLHAAGLLKAPAALGRARAKLGHAGIGQWITVYANRGHAYAVIAGLRWDTSAVGEPINNGSGPRWRSTARTPSRLHHASTPSASSCRQSSSAEPTEARPL